MRDRLPRTFSPSQLAQSGEVIAGALPVESLPRVLEALAASAVGESESIEAEPGAQPDQAPAVTVRIEGQAAGSRGVSLAGEVRLVARVQCQRCLDPMELTVSRSIAVRVVNEEASDAALPASVEAVVSEDGRISLSELVEDELLLAWPDSPVHDVAECRAPDYVQPDDTQPDGADNDEDVATRRPFAGLADLMNTG